MSQLLKLLLLINESINQVIVSGAFKIIAYLRVVSNLLIINNLIYTNIQNQIYRLLGVMTEYNFSKH